MRVKSYAKVNLILKVGPKKEKLHDLFSVVAKIRLHDILDIKIIEKDEVIVETTNAKIKQNDNLVYKAIMLLKQKTKFIKGVKVIIQKKIPLQSGLGGGSSNAATTLKYLNKKLNLALTTKQLINLAFKLGSDVPAFIYEEHVQITKQGQKVEPLNLKLPRYLLLIKPKTGVSAKLAYELFDNDNLNQSKFRFNKIKNQVKSRFKEQMFSNDLQEPVFKKYPTIKKAYQAIESAGFENRLMSGSGSVVLGATDSQKIAFKAYENLKKNYNFVVLTQFLRDGK
jgi:4-diphosphocytidyl-2-C-methyl-D-erythritol kinase